MSATPVALPQSLATTRMASISPWLNGAAAPAGTRRAMPSAPACAARSPSSVPPNAGSTQMA